MKKRRAPKPKRVQPAEPPKQEKRRLRRPLVLGAASGTLYLLSMPGLLWGGLAFVALVPLLVALLRARRASQALVASAAAGIFLFLPGLIWVQYVTPVGWVALACYCAAWFVAVGMILYRLRRLPAPLWALEVGAVWVLQEYGRATLMTGFPWFFLSHSQAGALPLAQAADLFGAYGLTVLLGVLNALLALGVVAWLEHRKLTRRHARLAAVLVVLLALWIGYGCLRLARIRPRPLGMRVAMVQGNVPQRLKEITSGHFDPDRIINHIVALTERLKADEQPGDGTPIGLVIWPETTILTSHIINVDPKLLVQLTRAQYVRRAIYMQNRLKELTKLLDAPMLVGVASVTDRLPLYVVSPEDWRFSTRGGRPVYYNSACLVDRAGKLVARYDKIHIVPFGEYIPFEKTFPIMKKLVPYPTSCNPGREITTFTIPDPAPGSERTFNFCVTICYEDTDEALVRRMARRDIDFLVNISNDAWFRQSTELEQHLAAAVFRAVETRVGIVRSGNNGITCILDALGRRTAVLQRTVDGRVRRKGITGTLVAPVSGRGPRTLYLRIGDALIGLCLALVLVPLLLFFVRPLPARRGSLSCPSGQLRVETRKSA